MIIPIIAARTSGNETVFNVVDSDGVPVDLTVLNATVVTVEVCGLLADCGSTSIDSSTTDVSFLNDTVTVKFGMLDLNPSPPFYFPKISYITATDDEPEVLAGEGYVTEIKLRVVC